MLVIALSDQSACDLSLTPSEISANLNQIPFYFSQNHILSALVFLYW
ncbi:hypothetical protein IFVP69_C160054 [Vibrio parahaemolyticus]|nr:hypothetical protein D050_3243 [Vibrio parahaemolyticus VPCR-2009]